jgi:hypothetical protein
MQNAIQIQFIRKFNMYDVGIVAGFPLSIADKLVGEGYARLFPIAKPDLEHRAQRKIMTKESDLPQRAHVITK